MLKIDLGSKVRKFLRKRPPKHEQQVLRKVAALAEDPFPFDAQLLKGYQKMYRADIGEYRIIYYIEGEWLHVPIVGKRNDSAVYKELRKRFG